MNAQIENEQTARPAMSAAAIGGIMGTLKLNTAQRNAEQSNCNAANYRANNNADLYVATLGRLYKHEGAPILEEVFAYAAKTNPLIKCNSACVGEKTYIDEYTNKKGKKSFAHYTFYGNYLEPAKEGDQPKCYVGNFQYVRFQTKLDQFRRPDVQSFETFQDLFTFEPIIKKTGKKITIPRPR
jgi:hypothetical protein